jgi:S-DNA-T family DNA segregation ATPase FtsK/SpoIIIE
MAYANTPEQAYTLLNQLQAKLQDRYKEMEEQGVNNIDLMKGLKEKRIVCIIEEYASLRLDKNFGKEIEDLIVYISNLGRASGIHLILATQRPDVNVISGRIKANIGSRACFATASSIDSKIVLDQPGAEKLGGKGDLLYLYPGKDPVRLQAFHL